MATEIDFYLLQNNVTHGKLRLACRVADKAYTAGHRLFIQTESAQQSRDMDAMLWTFAQGSFIPHGLAASADENQQHPVIIGEDIVDPIAADVLLNLSAKPCKDYQQFARVLEVVAADDDDKMMARQRFRFYRQHGVEPATHNITL